MCLYSWLFEIYVLSRLSLFLQLIINKYEYSWKFIFCHAREHVTVSYSFAEAVV